MLEMNQKSYVEKVPRRFKMEHSERGFLSIRHEISGMCREGTLDCGQDHTKYLRRTKDMFLVYGGGDLILECYSDASFQSDDVMPKHSQDLSSSLTMVRWLGRVLIRIPQLIPPRKLNT
ncbi:UNVERIFIED_CONTAM: hypothetical protein Slati_3061100 [Sesamum latifolium]|uniref:Uncharacterized protein n=1 Tax=Sesamum latifolium TaxID=2727402 RepID=A0AAW2UUA1_9LAMI